MEELRNTTAYSIHPIALCEGPRDSSHFAYRSGSSTTCNAVCYVWYIENSTFKILVDAGASASTFTKRGTQETDLTSVENGLGRLGLRPEDIDIVIITHLHCDHIALGYLYKRAKFIVQKKELDYALHPHPIDADLYDRSTFEDLNWDVIDGNTEITPGISVFLTPGHSPGGQSVEVGTLAGKAIVTGFCCTKNTFNQTQEMKRRGWEVTIPLIHQDTSQTYDSVLEVKHRAKIIIPLHEPQFKGNETIP
ncbi:MAG: N-acyl homoserine lactonase family protein, partial [Flavisolibacter sp.]